MTILLRLTVLVLGVWGAVTAVPSLAILLLVGYWVDLFARLFLLLALLFVLLGLIGGFVALVELRAAALTLLVAAAGVLLFNLAASLIGNTTHPPTLEAAPRMLGAFQAATPAVPSMLVAAGLAFVGTLRVPARATREIRGWIARAWALLTALVGCALIILSATGGHNLSRNPVERYLYLSIAVFALIGLCGAIIVLKRPRLSGWVLSASSLALVLLSLVVTLAEHRTTVSEWTPEWIQQVLVWNMLRAFIGAVFSVVPFATSALLAFHVSRSRNSLGHRPPALNVPSSRFH